ncbi:hypothetical protein [Streptomyces clavifer]|uniref:hypothetical protein n=1 Tax=Streptomyces clavifer TaxID=68188 RepID=UPI003801E21B
MAPQPALAGLFSFVRERRGSLVAATGAGRLAGFTERGPAHPGGADNDPAGPGEVLPAPPAATGSTPLSTRMWPTNSPCTVSPTAATVTERTSPWISRSAA